MTAERTVTTCPHGVGQPHANTGDSAIATASRDERSLTYAALVPTVGGAGAAATQARSAPVDSSTATPGKPASSAAIPTGKGTHGVTDSTITLGVWTTNSTAASAALQSFSGKPGAADNYDFERSVQLVAEYINNH